MESMEPRTARGGWLRERLYLSLLRYGTSEEECGRGVCYIVSFIIKSVGGDSKNRQRVVLNYPVMNPVPTLDGL